MRRMRTGLRRGWWTLRGSRDHYFTLELQLLFASVGTQTKDYCIINPRTDRIDEPFSTPLQVFCYSVRLI